MKELTLIAATLQRLHREGRLDIQRLSNATGLDDSTIYRWLHGRNDPGFTNIMLAFRHCGSIDLQHAIAALLFADTRWQAVYVEADLDADGDGDVDAFDAIKEEAAAAKAVTAAIDKMVSTPDELPGLNDLHVLRNELAQAAGKLLNASRITGHIIERETRRQSTALHVGGVR